MARLLPLLGALAVAACDGGVADKPAEPDSATAADDSLVLFDGTSLDHFAPLGDAEWTVKDGAVRSSGPASGFLVSKEDFGDFRLHAEFHTSEDANSGIFIRCQDAASITAENCYEVNIFDLRPDPAYRTGSIVHVAEPLAQIDAAGQWNVFEIEAVGNRLTVHMNDVLTVDTTHDGFSGGRIALQYGAGAVAFRNVRLERVASGAP